MIRRKGSVEMFTGIRRILMTTDTIGGVWRYALELCRVLEPRGIEVILAAMGHLSPEQEQEAGGLVNVDIRQGAFRLEWMEDPWTDVRAGGEWLMDLAAETQPDIIHLNSYAHGALPWNAPVLVVGHSCVFSWFAAVRKMSPPRQWRRYHREVARGLRGADRVTAPSRTMLNSLRTHYGVFTAHAPIANGRRADDFPPGRKEPFILSAGRLWDEAKNVTLLERIAPGLHWPIMVAGDSRHPDGGDRPVYGIRHLGCVCSSEMASWMGRASIFAMPAKYEPFGLSALEAGLAGCALVLGDIPSLREVWGDAAVFISPNDPEGLKDVLEDLIGSPEQRARYAAKSRARALGFTPERMAGEYLRLYEELILEPMKPAVGG